MQRLKHLTETAWEKVNNKVFTKSSNALTVSLEYIPNSRKSFLCYPVNVPNNHTEFELEQVRTYQQKWKSSCKCLKDLAYTLQEKANVVLIVLSFIASPMNSQWNAHHYMCDFGSQNWYKINLVFFKILTQCVYHQQLEPLCFEVVKTAHPHNHTIQHTCTDFFWSNCKTSDTLSS